VSPLSVQNGAFHATNLPQIEFQYGDSGGYNHYIISQHDGGNANCNSVDFFIYSAGGSQSSSSAPGTGNTQALSIRGDSVNTFKPLLMNDNYIAIRNDGTTGLAWGSAVPYSVGVDGPFLFGNTQGALGTTISTNDISLAWDTSVVEIYKTLNLNNQNITGVSSISAFGELSISANNDILTSAVSTINTVQNTYFTGTVSKRLDGVGIQQPIIQYGQVSSSGSSGSVVVTIPTQYTAVNTYLPFACMSDAPAAEIYVSTLTNSTFEIGWQNGGGGNQLFNWHTMGN
jgi:hypothetical protein